MSTEFFRFNHADKNVIDILRHLKQFLWKEEYSSCFKQRLAEGYSLIHTPRRLLSHADARTELLVSFFGDNKGLSKQKAETLFSPSLLNGLLKTELITCIPKTKKYVSTFRIVPINQFLIIIPFRAYNDPPVYIGADSLTFFRHINSRKQPQNVLDLATGSGFQLFGLPWQGGSTTMIGIDINPNAVNIANLNSKINFTPWMKFFQHDITQNLSTFEQEFDLIIGNPPIIPTPRSISTRLQGMIHADGGEDGFEVVRKLIPNALSILKKDGSIQLILSSLGNDKPSNIKELRQICHNDNLSTQFVVIKKIPVELDSYYRGQKSQSEYNKWMSFYKKQGYRNWFRSIVRIYHLRSGTEFTYKSLIRSDFDKSPNRERLSAETIEHKLEYYLKDTLMQKKSSIEIKKAKELLSSEIKLDGAMTMTIRDFGIHLAEKFPQIFPNNGSAIRFWGQCTNEFWWKPKYLERVLW